MIAVALALLALAAVPRSAAAENPPESPPAPTIDPSEAERAIAPHVSRIKSCRPVGFEEVVCLVVRHRRHESAHAVRHRPAPGTKGIRVFYTPGWGKRAS